MLLYRRGSKFPDNLCPWPGLDLDGLSTFDTLERAVDPGEKAQVIDTDKLKTLLALPAEPPAGHVCLTPRDAEVLAEWAATRGTGAVHPLTAEVLAAIVDTVRKSR
jgi:hypothetical protein